MTVNGPFALLGDGRFFRVWVAGGFVGTMRWLEILVIGVFTLEVTGSAFQVALMMMLRSLPMFLFGTVSGAIAEQVNRKVIMVCALTAATLVAVTLATMAHTGRIEVWHIGVGAFLSGMLWTTEFPVRRTMLGEIAGASRIGPAMGLDSATTNGTRMLGPALGGLLYETIGLDGAYMLGAGLYTIGCGLILSLDYTPAQPMVRQWNVFKTIREGLVYVRGNRAIVATLAVTVIMNVWGFPFAAMVPVIGVEDMGLSAFPIGILMSAEGAGAFMGALLIATFARPEWFNRLYLCGSFLVMVMVAIFSFSTWFGLSLGLLLTAGFGAAGFSAMQTTTMFTLAPPEMRGRVMGVLSVCIGAGPLGMLHMGLLAGWLGASTAVLVVALEGIAALAIAARVWWELR
ncbi:MAG: MFS transporter [Alphaproteobacteria bacterium]